MNLATIAEQAASKLMKVSCGNCGNCGNNAYIETPILFPSGTPVTVAIQEEGDGLYRVTDIGRGASEYEGEATYSRNAKREAALVGILFRANTFIASNLREDQLPGAIMTVANAAARAVHVSILNECDIWEDCDND